MPARNTARVKTASASAIVDDELLAHAKALISIPSVSTDTKELQRALDYVEALIAIHPGITIEHFEQNGKPSLLAYYGPKRPKRFKVLLSGHVDVIPADPNQFIPRVVGDRMYGRGTLDMKMTVLVFTQLFCKLAPTLPYAFGLQITTDEEVGGHDGVAIQRADGVTADFMIAGERTCLDISTAAKGLSWIRVSTTGKSEHGAYPWRGDNALTKLTHLAERLMQIYPIGSDDEWQTSVSIASIRTPNTTVNRIPDEAEMDIDIRHIAGDPHFTSRESVRTFIRSIVPDCDIHFYNFDPSIWVDPTDDYVVKLKKAMEKARGQEVKLLHRPASSDLRHYGADENVRPVEFGLSGDDAHGDEEFVDLTSVPQMQAGLTDFLQSL